jgi:hypothetical protein
MRRRLRVKFRTDKVLFDQVCRDAGAMFREQRYRDALAIYEQFAKEHPDTRKEEIQHRILALKDYIEGHAEKYLKSSTASTP